MQGTELEEIEGMQHDLDGYAVPIEVESVALVSDCSCCRKTGPTHPSIQRQ